MASIVANRKSNEKLIEYRRMEAEIQQQWREGKIFETDAPTDDSKCDKFFATFPYPYMNGKLHLGHSFSVSKVDFAVAYQRLLGKKCLFPLGFHCTGMPILACANKLKKEVELYGNPPVFPQEQEELAQGDSNQGENQNIDDIMAKDRSKAKKSKVQAKSGGAKYQWEIMRDNIRLSDEETQGLTEQEIKAKIDTEINKFIDPVHWFNYFPQEAMRDLESFGAGIDWRRTYITTDVNPFYDSFVNWQFWELKERNRVKFGKRYSIYSPKDDQPCMDHDRASGEGVAPQEYTLIKVKVLKRTILPAELIGDKQLYLLAATLRPETMYGQTNLWLKPDMVYIAFNMINNEIGICSYRAALNMSYQNLTPTFGKVDVIAELEGQQLLGSALESPLALNKVIYTLPMMTIQDTKGTGVVTSVPSDSPDDWMALQDLKIKPALREKFNIQDEMVLPFEPIQIIDVAGYGPLSAKKICEELQIKSQNDREKLTKAKEIVYLKGFYDGKMIVSDYEGKKVNEVRKPIQKLLVDSNDAIIYMEPEKQVISRSGDECVVALCDQWYLDYGDEEWKKLAREALKQLETYSDETRKRFETTIDWLHGHACSRLFGLGTKLPWDKKWVIDSLSDSTIYMAYYTVAHLLQGGKLAGDETTSPLGIKPDQMTPEVWNYIFRGSAIPESSTAIPPIEVLQRLRQEFLFWYPMDLRSSGKDLVPNHLTFSLFNHSSIWESDWKMMPKSMRANGHLLLDGQKMSKSTGNFLTLQSAIELYGADAVRYALADAGDGLEDANFVANQAETGLLKLFNLIKWSEETLQSLDRLRDGTPDTFADRTFSNAMNRLISETKQFYDKMMFREALRTGFFEYQDLRTKYKEMCGSNGVHRALTRRYIETQAIILSPICPHASQKIWQLLGNDGFLTKTQWPTVDEVDENLHKMYMYLNESLHEFRVRLRVFQTPPKQKKNQSGPIVAPKATKASIYVAKNFPPWQAAICQILHDLYIEHNGQMPDNKIIASQMAKCDLLKKYMKKAMPFAELRKQLIMNLGEEAFNLTVPFDEIEVLKDNMSYLQNALEVGDISIMDAAESNDQKIIDDCCPSCPIILFSAE